MDKKYQVFVSSTYEDLKEERSEVIRALLQCDCIPVGMELFPAADDEQWEFIKNVIDECDYYIAIIAGRYGTCDGAGMGYTEKEYRHALDQGKPIAGFVHGAPSEIPSGKCDSDPDAKKKLTKFTALVKRKLCKTWRTAHELAGAVSLSMQAMKRSHPAIGWVRADAVSTEEDTRELLEAKKEVDRLKKQLGEEGSAGVGARELAQGQDRYSLSYFAETYTDPDGLEDDLKVYEGSVRWAWDDIFASIAPRMMSPISKSGVQEEIEGALLHRECRKIEGTSGFKQRYATELSISEACTDDILIQFGALSLVKRVPAKRGADGWMLTKRGELNMFRLRAARR